MPSVLQRHLDAFASGQDRPDLRTRRVLRNIERGNIFNRHYIAHGGERLALEATASAKRWSSGAPLGALDGLLLAVKDNIDVAGFATTAGSRLGMGIPARSDAAVVDRLRAAGALVVGKVNMNEAALGVDGANAVHGDCRNPRWANHSCGGSSSGSAAVVAAGTADLSLGTDTMGSVRLPAAFCGLVGYKPTNGLLPNSGVVPLCHALDSVGMIARTVDDVSRLLRAMGLLPATERRTPLACVRFGLPLGLSGIAMSGAVERAWHGVLARLREAGVSVLPIPVAEWNPGNLRRDALLHSEMDAWAHWSGVPGAFDANGLTPAMQAMLTYPHKVGVERLQRARESLAAASAAWTYALGQVDVVLMPTAPVASFTLGSVAPVGTADLTVPANVAGAPAISLPLGRRHPRVGLQLIASRQQDDHLLAVARSLEALLHDEASQPV